MTNEEIMIKSSLKAIRNHAVNMLRQMENRGFELTDLSKCQMAIDNWNKDLAASIADLEKKS